MRIPRFLKALPSHRKMAKIAQRYEFVAEIYKFWSLITLFLLLNISYCTRIHYSVRFHFCFIIFFGLTSIWFSVYYEIVNILFFIFFNFVGFLILVFSDFSLRLFLCISLRKQAILVVLDGDGGSCQQNFWCACNTSLLTTHSGL